MFLHSNRIFTALAVTVVTLAIAVWALFLPAKAQPTALGPTTTVVSVGTAAILAALPANPSRRGFTICNGSATLFVTFTTGSVTPVSLTTGVVLQTGNVVASCQTILAPAGGGGIGAQVNIIGSAAGPTNVTFLEYQ